jgi:hypothetical protein
LIAPAEPDTASVQEKFKHARDFNADPNLLGMNAADFEVP